MEAIKHRRWLTGVALALLAQLAAAGAVTAQNMQPTQAGGLSRQEKAAQALYLKRVKERGAFGAFLLEQDAPRRAITCHTIGEELARAAASAPDPDERAARLPQAWRLLQRVAPAYEQAQTALTGSQITRLNSALNDVLNLATMVPDPAMAMPTRDFSETALMDDFIASLAMRCHQSLDENGVADDSSPPSPEFLARFTGFRYRGMDAEATFADTALGPFAAMLCRNQTSFDFTGAPLDQRGDGEMSLLDWAMECEDRAGFDALITAGFDLDAPGLGTNPPVVRAASELRLWYLEKLLDAGANPDARGETKTALAEAADDLDASNAGRNTRAAYDLLRARGASLSFPDFTGSMWYQWGLHGRNDGWAKILAHWDEFASDPVELGNLAEGVITGQLNWMADQKGDAAKVKQLLITQFGVCFPVGRTFEMEKDARGFVIQPNCPKKPVP